MREIRFDDLPALRAVCGGEFGAWSEGLHITQDLIDQFADLTGDHQWIHVDRERSRSGPFGTTVAHGLLTLAITPRIRPPADFEVVGHAKILNYGSDAVRFLAPVLSGATIRSRGRLIAADEHPRGTKLSYEMAVHVVGQDRPAMLSRPIVLYTAE
ncbi:MaoC family dehydratase [Jiangella sp. DSM 45060]|uniref:MaoC family dehydratase n=1 Tax=Jiangella sp. DSM 45060 TaxID=1798224 RepID=UPI00087CDFEB|nr:MaoC family dehydratase [Jiangella sp. DSM 45060]SDT32564.1 Acyl dehydratase [Jiangella sp. DSM 45060]